MNVVAVLGAVLMAVAAGPEGGAPKSSADVVEVKLVRHTLADGLECFLIDLKVARGWHVYANVEGRDDRRGRPKPQAGAATVFDIRADGKPASVHSLDYPKGVAKKGADGREYLAYEGSARVVAWLVWDETKNATVSVRVRVVATDGKTRLKESTLTAEAR
jgi:hypothetical protein